MSGSESETDARTRGKISLAGFLGTVALGCLGLLGWLTGWRVPASVLPHYVPMAPSTAICFLLLGATGLLCFRNRETRIPAFLPALAVGFVIAVAVTDAFEFWGVIPWDLEQLLFTDPERLYDLPWAKMSPMTGALFLLSGLMMLCCLIPSGAGRKPPILLHAAGMLSVVVVFSAFTILLGYVYGTPFLYGSPIIPVAATTALAFLLLGVAVLSGSGPHVIPNRYFSGPTIRARLIRVFVPLVFVAVLLQGIVHRCAPLIWDINRAMILAVVAILLGVLAIIVTSRAALTVGSELDRAHRSLRESEERFRTLIENAGSAIICLTPDFRIVEFNNEAERLHGRSREEVLGKSYLDLFVADHLRDFLAEHFLGVTEELPSRGFEAPIQSGNGEKRTLLWHVDALSGSEGGPQGILAVGMDITERKRAQQERESLQQQLFQAQKMEALGTLSGGIAHDFNNLLHIIMGYSDFLLTDAPLSEEMRADLGKINNAARNGAELVRGLLTLSRRVEPKLRAVNVNDAAEQVRKILMRTIPKTIDVKLALADELPKILADSVQVEQLLMNLAINARDAMPEGGTLTIETQTETLDEDYCKIHLDAQPGDYVLLSVTDTGLGMDKQTVERIFEPFFTTKGPGEGTGLGLAMVYGIVKQHGGYIRCYSEAGHGTRFIIHFPVLQAEERPKETESPEELSCGTETLLVVDDEELVRELAEGMLTRYGYSVMTATNGREALELYQKERCRISLVILDLIMPEMGGDRCLHEILKIDPNAKVLIASGFSSQGSATDVLAAGARGFVGKPYELKRLVGTVRKILDQR